MRFSRSSSPINFKVRTASALWSRGSSVRAFWDDLRCLDEHGNISYNYVHQKIIAARQIWTHRQTHDAMRTRTSLSSVLWSRRFWTNTQNWSATSTMYVNNTCYVFSSRSSADNSVALRNPSRARGQSLNRDSRLLTWLGKENSHCIHIAESQRVLHRTAAGDQG